MKKGRIVILAAVALAAALALMLTACNSGDKTGWATSFTCGDVQTLRTVFGGDFVYPSGESVSDIIVKCEPEDSLDDYIDGDGNLIEPVTIPALVKAEAADIYQGVALKLIIVKNNSERTGWSKISTDDMRKISTNGMEVYQSADKKAYVYEPKEGQSYYLAITSEVGAELDTEEFAYHYFKSFI